MEIVCTYTLEGVGRGDGVCGWQHCLGWGHAVAVARVMWMSLVIPGQKTDVSARAITDDTPWWAAWRAVRQCGLMDGGITILSLYSTTPLTQ